MYLREVLFTSLSENQEAWKWAELCMSLCTYACVQPRTERRSEREDCLFRIFCVWMRLWVCGGEDALLCDCLCVCAADRERCFRDFARGLSQWMSAPTCVCDRNGDYRGMCAKETLSQRERKVCIPVWHVQVSLEEHISGSWGCDSSGLPVFVWVRVDLEGCPGASVNPLFRWFRNLLISKSCFCFPASSLFCCLSSAGDLLWHFQPHSCYAWKSFV